MATDSSVQKRVYQTTFMGTINYKDIESEKAMINYLKPYIEDKKLFPFGFGIDMELPGIDYFIFQCEKESCFHLQYYIETKKRCSFQQCKDIIMKILPENLVVEPHVEKAKYEKNSISYCARNDKRFENMGPWVYGTPGIEKQGKRTDLQKHADTIKEKGLREAIRERPDMYIRYTKGTDAIADFYAKENAEFKIPNVILLYGESGAGKSRYVYDNHGYSEVSCPYAVREGVGYKIWYDDYKYQENILLEEFNPSIMGCNDLKRVLDGHPCSLPYKGGSRFRSNCENIYLATNEDPHGWFLNLEREHKYAFWRRFKTVIKFNRDGSKVVINDPLNHFLNDPDDPEVAG